MAENKFCVIGLGYFGENLVKELVAQEAEVIAIDKDENRLNRIKDIVSFAVSLNTMNEIEMEKLGIQDVDAAIVAIGEGFEDSIVTTAILKNIGVKRVITRILSPIHEKLLNALDVSETLVPEAEAANHLAKRLMLPGVIETYRISTDHSIFEIKVPQWMIGRTVSDVELRQKYSLNIVTIKRKIQKYGINIRHSGETMVIGTPSPTQIFTDDDILVLFGKEKDFAKFIKE
jgi:trk system potassium uptake protein TrkA